MRVGVRMGPDKATEEGRRHHLRSLALGNTEPKSESCSLDDIGGSFRKRYIGNGELHEGALEEVHWKWGAAVILYLKHCTVI